MRFAQLFTSGIRIGVQPIIIPGIHIGLLSRAVKERWVMAFEPDRQLSETDLLFGSHRNKNQAS